MSKVINGKLSTYTIIDDENVIIFDRRSPGDIGPSESRRGWRVTELRYAKAVSAPLAPIGFTQAAGRKYSEIAAASFFLPRIVECEIRAGREMLIVFRLPSVRIENIRAGRH
jgi:hypothetical protein